jgi:hypothetical protein
MVQECDCGPGCCGGTGACLDCRCGEKKPVQPEVSPWSSALMNVLMLTIGFAIIVTLAWLFTDHPTLWSWLAMTGAPEHNIPLWTVFAAPYAVGVALIVFSLVVRLTVRKP